VLAKPTEYLAKILVPPRLIGLKTLTLLGLAGLIRPKSMLQRHA
jgi:hypothetical protein